MPIIMDRDELKKRTLKDLKIFDSEDEIRQRFIGKILSLNKNSVIFELVKSFNLPRKAKRSFYPDIDVLEFQPRSDGSIKLIGYEIKRLEGSPSIIDTNGTSKKVKVLQKKHMDDSRAVDKNFYNGIGQALLYLQYLDESYLVIQKIGLTDGIKKLIQHLPIGLISFDEKMRLYFEKKPINSNENFPIYKDYRDIIIKSDKTGPKHKNLPIYGRLDYSKWYNSEYYSLLVFSFIVELIFRIL